MPLKQGNVIYQPEGPAAEYATWACNLYNGCAHSCSYCYCKRGVMSHAMGGALPTLKKTAGTTEDDAFAMFKKELTRWKSLIIADGGGLFFSFSTDPMLECEIKLTMRCITFALENRVPVAILTKAVWWCYNNSVMDIFRANKELLTIGFTLTGCDEEEGAAPSNELRANALVLLSGMGFKTFASVEPVIRFDAAYDIINSVAPFCPEFRIGLLSPYKKDRYDWQECDTFIDNVTSLSLQHGFIVRWKKSINRIYQEQKPKGGAPAPSPSK